MNVKQLKREVQCRLVNRRAEIVNKAFDNLARKQQIHAEPLPYVLNELRLNLNWQIRRFNRQLSNFTREYHECNWKNWQDLWNTVARYQRYMKLSFHHNPDYRDHPEILKLEKRLQRFDEHVSIMTLEPFDDPDITNLYLEPLVG